MVLRASSQKREEKERVRLVLMRAALRLSAEHGFASLGLREVSRAGAIAPTSFYRHFADMPELGTALVEELVRPLLGSLAKRAIEADESATGQRAASLVDGMLLAVGADAELVRFIVAERVGAFASLRRALAAEFDALATVLEAPQKSGARGGQQPSSGAAADAVVALLFDGFARALDLPIHLRAELRERLIASLTLVLEASRGAPRQP